MWENQSMPSEIMVPFYVGADGRVAAVSDPDKQVRQHVRALVSTQPTERVTVPGYGVDTHSLVFEDADGEDVASQARIRVNTALDTWEQGVMLERVEVDEDSEGNFAAVSVIYARKDAADSGMTANTNVAIIGANGVVREVVRG